MDSRDSFVSVEKWIAQVNQRTPASVRKLLIANKVDVEAEKREVAREEGEAMADKYGLQYVEVSAKANLNIDEVFYTLARIIKAQMEAENRTEYDSLSRTITLNSTAQRGLGAAKEEEGQGRRCAC